jgi:hypothetical protein
MRALLIVLLLACGAAGAAERSRAVRAEFVRENACPSTGRTSGPCPGWQVDHVVPLCLGGPAVDTKSNLIWRTVADHKQKTREDVKLCRAVRRQVVAP